ncbi:MAG: NmrA family protein, partial [Actinomycetia bacterium]|nr:NmrA family protein [Actinomycetes bacterium]
ARAPALPGAGVGVAAYGDGPALAAALDGADTLFLVSAAESADRIREHTSTVDAAVAAGIRRIVYTSFLGASPDATFTLARDHWHTEQHVRAAGVDFTFLRDNLYLDMFPLFTGPDGVIRGPAGDGRAGAVSRDDIAAVAVAVLLDPAAHAGATYDLTGPESISLDEAAAALTEAAGRPIRYHAETLDEAYASRAGYGAPDWEVAGWVTSYAAIATGELDVVTSAVTDLTGRRPASLREFLAAHPEALRA